VLLLIVAAAVSLCAGDRWMGPESWFGADGQLFVWQIRLPRTLAVILVGAALALCGTMMQALFENPLAEPGCWGYQTGRAWG
jgi:vitamin B12 transport system permease protein